MWVLHSTQRGLSRLEVGNFAEIQKYLCGGKKSATPGVENSGEANAQNEFPSARQ